MSRIFISYKRVDKEKVFKIKDQIESALGEKCWIDLDGIESDAVFANKIIGAINSCEVFLFMYSKAHSLIDDFNKDWTVREINFASKKGKRIVFINIDGALLTDPFEFTYGIKQQIDGRNNESIERLIRDLKKWLEIADVNLQNNMSKKLQSKLRQRLNRFFYDNKRQGMVVVIVLLVLFFIGFIAFWFGMEKYSIKQIRTYDFVTKTYRIKVREMKDGSFVYSSWKVDAAGPPDIVIHNGCYDRLHHCYVFKNGIYYYYVGDKKCNNCSEKCMADSLIVKKQDEVLYKGFLSVYAE